MIMMCK